MLHCSDAGVGRNVNFKCFRIVEHDGPKEKTSIPIHASIVVGCRVPRGKGRLGAAGAIVP